MVRVTTPRGAVFVSPGDFLERIKEAARIAGLSRFRVFIGDIEISPANPPAQLTEDMLNVTICAYDVGA